MLKEWDHSSGELPSEEIFAALVADIAEGRETREIGKVGTRLNYEIAGMSSLFRTTSRKAKKLEAPFKESLIDVKEGWGDIATWNLLKRESGKFTPSYYLAAIDMRIGADGGVEAQPENRQVYVNLFIRTLWLSTLITTLCLLLGYPIAYLLATLPVKTSNLLMILVLLPFWG